MFITRWSNAADNRSVVGRLAEAENEPTTDGRATRSGGGIDLRARDHLSRWVRKIEPSVPIRRGGMGSGSPDAAPNIWAREEARSSEDGREAARGFSLLLSIGERALRARRLILAITQAYGDMCEPVGTTAARCIAKAMPSEERTCVFIERPDIQRQERDPQTQPRSTHHTQQSAADTSSPKFGDDADVMHMKRLVRIGERCLRSANDFSIGITCRSLVDECQEYEIVRFLREGR
jgi:hypothetical protein